MKYSLLQLANGENWPENDKKNFKARYTAALGNYLIQELSKMLSEEQRRELVQKIQQENLSPNEVVDFYKSKLPEMDKIAEEKEEIFLQQFFIDLYTVMCTQIEAELKTESSEQDQLVQELQTMQNVLQNAKDNNWHEVITLLNTISY